MVLPSLTFCLLFIQRKRANKKAAYKKREQGKDAERKAVMRLKPHLKEKYAQEMAEKQLKGKSKSARCVTPLLALSVRYQRLLLYGCCDLSVSRMCANL